MMNYVLILLISILIILISNLFGNKIARLFKLNKDYQYTALGFSAILAILFIVYIPLVRLNASALITNYIFCYMLLLISIFALYNLIKKINYPVIDLLIILAYVVIMVYLSTKFTIGEELGDTNFYFTIVQRNIDSTILGQFTGYNGGIYPQSVIGLQYAYQSFYQFWSAILWFIDSIFGELIVNSAIYMWCSNIIFYFFTIEVIMNIYKIFKSKNGLIANIVFIGLFTGSFYYNLSLPWIGVIFFTVLLTNEITIIYQCLYKNRLAGAWIIAIFSLAIISCASTGLFISFFLSYAYIMTLVYLDNPNALHAIGIIALPIMIYSIIFQNNIYFTIICLIIEIILILLPRFISYKSKQYPKFMLILKGLIVVIPIMLIVISLFISSNISQSFSMFFHNYSNYDRIQDYFSFENITVVLKNVVYYICLLSLLINKKTRYLGILLLIIIITFINPLMVPFIIKYMTKYEVYQRVFYLMFNNGFLMIGLAAFFDLFTKSKTLRTIVLLTILIPSIYFFYNELTYKINPIYEPSSKNNLLYKLDQNQIDAVKAVSKAMKKDNLYYPKVISQIYGTIIIEPKITLINGVLERRFYDSAYKKDETLRKLIEIFYTPVYEGDDKDRFTADYLEIGELVKRAKIEFVIVDKSLSVTNEYNDWMPLSYFMDIKASVIYENDDYIVYQYNYQSSIE